MNFEKKLMAYKVIAILLLGFSLAGMIQYSRSTAFYFDGKDNSLPALLQAKLLTNDQMVLEHHLDVPKAIDKAMNEILGIFSNFTDWSGHTFQIKIFPQARDVFNQLPDGIDWVDRSKDQVVSVLVHNNKQDLQVVEDIRINFTLAYLMAYHKFPEPDQKINDDERAEMIKQVSLVRDNLKNYRSHMDKSKIGNFHLAFTQDEIDSLMSYSGLIFSVFQIGQTSVENSDPRFDEIGKLMNLAWNWWPGLYHSAVIDQHPNWVICWNILYRLGLLAWVALVVISLIWLVRLNLKSSLHKEVKLLGLPLETTNLLFRQNWKFRIWPVKESLIREVVNSHHIEIDQQRRKEYLLQKAGEVLGQLDNSQNKPDVQRLIRIIYDRNEVLNGRERALNELLAVEERLRRLAAKEPVQAVETPAEEDRPLPKLKGERGGPRTEALNRIRSFTDGPLPELILGLSPRKLEYLHRTLLLVSQNFGTKGVQTVIKHPQLEHLLNLQSAMMQAVLNEDSARVGEILHLTEVGASAQ